MAAKVKCVVPNQKILYPRQKVNPSMHSKPVAPRKVKCVNIGGDCCKLCDDNDLKNMIQCIWCSSWTHATCAGISLTQLQTLIDVKDNCPFQCKTCITMLRIQWSVLKKDLGKIETAINQMTSNVTEIDTRLQAVERSVIFKDHEDFKTAVKFQTEHMKADLQAAVDKQVKQISNDIKTDLHDNYIRRNRLVFFGIESSPNDVEMLKSLANELGIENLDIKKTFRIKAKRTNNNISPLPLNVEFHCVDDKYVFLNKSVKEKLSHMPENSQFYGISIAPDRSFKEREAYRLLKQEMNKRNEDLISSGVLNTKWIIKQMHLTQEEVEQDD